MNDQSDDPLEAIWYKASEMTYEQKDMAADALLPYVRFVGVGNHASISKSPAFYDLPGKAKCIVILLAGAALEQQTEHIRRVAITELARETALSVSGVTTHCNDMPFVTKAQRGLVSIDNEQIADAVAELARLGGV